LGGHELARLARAALGPGGVPPRLQRLAGDERGVVAVIFAITFSAIFLAVAVAIDYARTQTEAVRVQNALDAAALAAAHWLGLGDQDATGRQDADRHFKVNAIKHKDVGVLQGVVMDADKGEVVATAKDNMLTSLLKAVGVKTIGFRPQCDRQERQGHS
jgi:Flp pilus assembly protein TadG